MSSWLRGPTNIRKSPISPRGSIRRSCSSTPAPTATPISYQRLMCLWWVPATQGRRSPWTSLLPTGHTSPGETPDTYPSASSISPLLVAGRPRAHHRHPARPEDDRGAPGSGAPLVRLKLKEIATAGVERLPRVEGVVDGKPQLATRVLLVYPSAKCYRTKPRE